MTNLPFIFDDTTSSDDTPLPLIVAKRWNFPLAYHQTNDGIYYAVQDWIKGLVGVSSHQASKDWTKIKKKTSLSKRSLPYAAADGKTYHPRNSFAVWKQIVRNTARPWSAEELSIAEAFKNVLTGIALRHLHA